MPNDPAIMPTRMASDEKRGGLRRADHHLDRKERHEDDPEDEAGNRAEDSHDDALGQHTRHEPAARDAERLEDGDVALAIEARQVGEQSDDRGGDDPQQQLQHAERACDDGERSAQIVADLRRRLDGQSRRQIVGRTVDDDRAGERLAAVRDALRILERQQDARGSAVHREAVDDADDRQRLARERDLLPDPRAGALVDDRLA